MTTTYRPTDSQLRKWPYVMPDGKPSESQLRDPDLGPRLAKLHGLKALPPRTFRGLDDLCFFWDYGYEIEAGICTVIGRSDRPIKQGPTLEVRAWLRARYLRETGARDRRLARGRPH